MRVAPESKLFGIEITPALVAKALALAFSLGLIYAKIGAVGELLTYKISVLEQRLTRVELKLDR